MSSIIKPREHHLELARVATIFNGSNIMLSTGVTGVKCRLADIQIIDDPMVRDAAKNYLMKNLLGRWVGLELGMVQWDKFGRKIANVWFGEGFNRNIGQELIDNNLAMHYSIKMTNSMKMYHPREFS